jgi:hypothetical protein
MKFYNLPIENIILIYFNDFFKVNLVIGNKYRKNLIYIFQYLFKVY